MPGSLSFVLSTFSFCDLRRDIASWQSDADRSSRSPADASNGDQNKIKNAGIYKAECGFNLRPTYLRQQRRVDDLDEWNILNRFGADDWSEFRACFADRKVSRV